MVELIKKELIPIHQALQEYVDRWMMLECSEKLFPCDQDEIWRLAKEILVEPYDVKRLFEYLQQGSYVPKSYSLQFFQTQSEQNEQEETIFILRYNDQTVDRIPLSVITLEGSSWEKEGVYQFIERLQQITKQETPPSSTNFETVDLILDDEIEEDLLELASTFEISVDQMEEIDELLDHLLEDEPVSLAPTATTLDPTATETSKSEPAKEHIVSEQSTTHIPIMEEQKMEFAHSTETKLPNDTQTKIYNKIEHTLQLVDKGFETSAQLYVKNSTEVKELMKQLLYMEQELRDIQKLLDGVSE